MEIQPQLPVRVLGMDFNFTTIFMTFVVMGIIIVLAYIASRKIKMIPGRAQALMEILVGAFDKLCSDTLGKTIGRRFLAYIGTLFIFIAICNIIGIIPINLPPISLGSDITIPAIRFHEPTRDYNTTGALAVLVVIIAHLSGINYKGLKEYLKGYIEPNFLLLPLNIISKVAEFLSIGFRLYGNIFGGAVIFVIVSQLLMNLVIPIGLSFFFSIFVGIIQAFVFTMLALTYAAMEIGHMEESLDK